jgi:hypothetical protein
MHRSLPWLLCTVLVSVGVGASARAAVVATGQAVVTSFNPIVVTLTPDDVVLDAFGTPVNLGADLGALLHYATVSGLTFTGVLTSVAPGMFAADLVDGHYLCDPSCDQPFADFITISSIARMENLTGSFTPSLPGGLTYVLDNTLYALASGGSIETIAGPFAINAFQAEATPVSPPGCSGSDCNVAVTIPPTPIVNTASGEELTVGASLTFPAVTAPGDTTVVGVSNVTAALSSNFSFNDGVTFLDISTTATIDTTSAPITVCLDYAIAGVVSDPTTLRLLHAESGVWTDVTTSLDTVAHVICGEVTTLSPFAVASEVPPTTTTTSSTTTSTTTTTTMTPPEDTGFLPPDKGTAKCESAIGKALGSLIGCVIRCHTKQAAALLAGKTFDEEACERTHATRSCRAKYDKMSLSILAKGVCPTCLDAANQMLVADQSEALAESLDADLYCAGTTPIGGDEPGFVPPDKATAKCAAGAAKNAAKLVAAIGSCHAKRAVDSLNGKASQEESCEAAAKAKYDAADTKLGGCPPCLDGAHRGSLRDQVEVSADQANGGVYCAGTVPFEP